MRKYISFTLLLALLYSTGGYYFLFSTKQHYLQREVRKLIRDGLTEKDLTLIVVKPGKDSEITWLKRGREFLYHNNLYDVVKLKIHDRKIYYYCINDKKEKKLVSDFNRNQASRKGAEKKLKRVMGSNYCTPKIIQITNLHTTDFKFPAFDFHYKSGILKIPSPPPRMVS